MGELLRSSGAISVEDYEVMVNRMTRYDRFTQPLRLRLRQVEPENKLGDLVSTLQQRTTEALLGIRHFSQPDESQDTTYGRVRGQLDEKYQIPTLALYYHAVGDVGADNPENALALAVSEDLHNQYLMEAFNKEYPNKHSPFRELNDLYAEGVWPQGFRVIEDTEVFVVHVPITFRAKSSKGVMVLGCWSDGEKAINYAHSFSDNCQYNLNMSSPLGRFGVPRRVEESDHSFFVSEPPEIDLPQ